VNDAILPDWQRAYGEPPASCRIRKDNADFQVNEQLGFDLSGDGEHDYLQIEKDGANTNWVARGLAKYACIAESDVGFAGMKDRHAVTTQWFSVRRPAGDKADWQKLELEGVRVLLEGRHQRKLRRGAHTGNQFRIAMKNLRETGDALSERLSTIRDAGVPNYFGEQRFGRDGGNLDLARNFFGGKHLKRSKRSIAMSAARSFLFNRILEDRIAAGNWNRLLAGDCANLDGSGSIFRVDQAEDELQHRCAALDVHPSGALWGSGELQTDGKVAELEESVVNAYPELKRGLERKSILMARRALRLAVRDFSWEREADTLWLRFFLVRGGYATAVLREIASYDS
jgi:tRNA pseudouridine13 synthase